MAGRHHSLSTQIEVTAVTRWISYRTRRFGPRQNSVY